MAPDLNGIAHGDKWDYSAPGSTGYDIPDVTLNDSSSRRLRVLTIGAGVSGILMAYQIQKYCPNVSHVIYEKNADIGGTWLENRYPGCACDIPSHAYTLNFALNPDWPRFFSYSPDIWKYLDKVCETFDLRKYMNFKTEVVGCEWEDDKGEWVVTLRKGDEQWVERCDLLLHACGILNNFKWPKIPGMEKFKGRILHTARWDEDYQKEQWKNDKVAIIGSGASSIQTVPNMQPHAKHLDVFVRTGVWFVQIANNFGANKEYTESERDLFRRDPAALAAHGKDIEDQVNGLWGGFYSDTPAATEGKRIWKAHMAAHIKDERLLEGFTPTFGVGCRRITPGDPYMAAIQKENVDVHFTAVEGITEDGVVGADGVERKVDAIVCATGFDVSYKPRFPIKGVGGLDLRDKWSACPESYLGLAVPDFPNFMTFIGPTWPVENGSVMGPLLTVSEYAVQIIKKMQVENLRSLAPKQEVTDAFNEHCQEWIKHTVWKESCRSWYKNNETGRVNAVWPGSSLHYQHVIAAPRYEDFDITYHNKRNQWAFLGLGWSAESRANNPLAMLDAQDAVAGALDDDDAGIREEAAASNVQDKEAEAVDFSPYINARFIDPKWLQANGMNKEEAKEVVIKATAEAAARTMREQLERAERGQPGAAISTTGFEARLL